MTRALCRLIGVLTLVASVFHLTSDIIEFIAGGFSRSQLLINYVGFLPVPFVFMGLYAIQHPRIGWLGLAGALLYAVSFIYFIHSTLYALEESIPNYETLWGRLGGAYTFHGGLMVVGGLLFGVASLRARVLGRKWLVLFIAGAATNLCLSLLPVPETLQIAGSTIRNAGLIGIGFELMLGTIDVSGEIPSMDQ
jgi:hypothetical protein